MNLQQPEALRLADALDLYATGDKHQRDAEEAAAELRRLHSANAQLLEALITLASASMYYFPLEPNHPDLVKARAAIAAAKGEA